MRKNLFNTRAFRLRVKTAMKQIGIVIVNRNKIPYAASLSRNVLYGINNVFVSKGLTWAIHRMAFKQIRYNYRIALLVLHTRLLSTGALTNCGCTWDAEGEILCCCIPKAVCGYETWAGPTTGPCPAFLLALNKSTRLISKNSGTGGTDSVGLVGLYRGVDKGRNVSSFSSFTHFAKVERLVSFTSTHVYKLFDWNDNLFQLRFTDRFGSQC